jgi:hypothetical protein
LGSNENVKLALALLHILPNGYKHLKKVHDLVAEKAKH